MFSHVWGFFIFMPKIVPLSEIIGVKYNKLIPIQEVEGKTQKNGLIVRHFLCLCECGNKTIVALGNIRGLKTKSCGCAFFDNIEHLIGKKFYYYTIIGECDVFTKTNNKLRGVICKCDCGNIKNIKLASILSGNTKSCGCLSKINPNRKTHGFANTSEYNIWLSAKQRCYNKNRKGYHRWGGRGIKMCDRWLESFENFYEDMGAKTSKNYSLERIDNNGNYCKENCKWATIKEQANNRITNNNITYNGQTKNITQWAEYFNIPKKLLSNRLNKGKMPFEKAISLEIKSIKI